MNIQYLIISILAFVMSCGLIPIPAATAQSDTPTVVATEISSIEALKVEQTQAEVPVPALDVWAVVTQIFNAVWIVLLEFGIPSLLVAWLMDFLIRIVPPLRPFRDFVLAYISNKLEDKQINTAENIVLGAGQDMRSRIFETKPEKREDLKDQRFSLAFDLIQKKTKLDDNETNLLLETAVARLKARGINP